MYLYTYVDIFTCVYIGTLCAYIGTHACTLKYNHVGISGHKLTLKQMCVCKEAYVFQYIHTYIHACVRACVRPSMHAYTHTHIHTYIHTFHTLIYITLHYIALQYITCITYIHHDMYYIYYI